MRGFEGLVDEALSLKLYQEIEKNFPNQADRVFKSPTCEIDPSFLGFVTQYYALSIAIPKEYIILDLGCYASAQAYFFREHRKYIGIDTYKGERFKFENTMNLKKDIREVIDKWGEKSKIIANTFVICNYASRLLDEEYEAKMRSKFRNIFNFYPTSTSK